MMFGVGMCWDIVEAGVDNLWGGDRVIDCGRMYLDLAIT